MKNYYKVAMGFYAMLEVSEACKALDALPEDAPEARGGLLHFIAISYAQPFGSAERPGPVKLPKEALAPEQLKLHKRICAARATQIAHRDPDHFTLTVRFDARNAILGNWTPILHRNAVLKGVETIEIYELAQTLANHWWTELQVRGPEVFPDLSHPGVATFKVNPPTVTATWKAD